MIKDIGIQELRKIAEHLSAESEAMKCTNLDNSCALHNPGLEENQCRLCLKDK